MILEKALAPIIEASEVVRNHINDEAKVNIALFKCVYPSFYYKKRFRLEYCMKQYYEEYYKSTLPPEAIRRKIKRRTKELLSKILDFLPKDLFDGITLSEWYELSLLEKAEDIVEARKIYNYQRLALIDFDSYRHLRSVSTPAEMQEVTDFKTKQAILRYKLLESIEFILNEMLKNLAYVDAIQEYVPISLSPRSSKSDIIKIEAYCSDNIVPEYFISKSKQDIIDELSRANKKAKVSKILDTVYEYMAFPRLNKRDACAIVYILFKNRKEIGFVADLDNYNKFRNMIFEYYKRPASSYKPCKLQESIDKYDFRVKNIIDSIK